MAFKKKKSKPPRLRRKRRRDEREASGLDLIEEAIHLLRLLPLASWACYLVGAAPFLVAFLFFWNDMALSGLAAENLLGDSLMLTLAYVWMRFWQACFIRGMWAALRGQAAEPVTLKTGLKILQLQLQWQTTALFALPVLALITIPFQRGYAFFQNLMVYSAICDEESPEPLTQRAIRLSGVWTGQGWALMGLLAFLSLMIYFSWFIVITTVPFLLKTFFGVDSAAIRSGEFLVMNSTTTSIALGLTYLIYDPLAKAANLLRCFYAQSLQSGEDLLFNLRTLKRASGKAARAATVGVLLLGLGLGMGQPLDASSDGTKTSEESLDSAIEQTMSQPDYIWRFPKEEVARDMEPPSWWQDFADWLKSSQEAMEEWFDSLFDDEEKPQKKSESWDFEPLDLSFLDGLTYLLIAVAVITLLWLLFKVLRSRVPAPAQTANVTAVETIPDLNREDITADQLPRNRWLEIAQELIAQGDYRLALRALFLAELSYLAEEGMIRLARHKSNYDYRCELSRRGDSSAEVLEAYQRSATLFDGVWYGERPVGQNEVEHMQDYLRNTGLAW